MLDFLYFVFVFPLENLLALILSAIFSAVGNVALSIILLALLVNFFLTKILRYSHKKSVFEAERKKRLDERINRWKTVYSRAKVFAFTQTLYRQNHYHPIFALSALGGLAIQIPFFYAMYFVIKNGNALPNTDFASISAIDSSLGIHILPILMTAITLFNVFLSSKETSARLQGLIIALLFLVLLYEMPHALVLYWTTNMAFALVLALFNQKQKNNVLNNQNIQNISNAKQQKTVLENIQQPFESTFAATPSAPFSLSLKIITGFFIGLCVVAIVLFFIATNFYAENANFLQRAGSFFTLLTGIAFLYFSFLAWRKYKNVDVHHFYNFKNLKQTGQYAILNIAFLICVFTPFALYQSDITQFHAPAMLPTLSALFGAFVLSAFVAIYLLSFMPKKLLWVVVFFLSMALALGLLDSFIFVGDYGAMDRFVFQKNVNPNLLERLIQNATRLLVIILAMAFVYFYLFKTKRIWQITFLTLIAVAMVNAFQIINARAKAEKAFQNLATNNSGGGG